MSRTEGTQDMESVHGLEDCDLKLQGMAWVSDSGVMDIDIVVLPSSILA